MNNRENDSLPHLPARVTRDPLESEDLLVDGPTCKTSVRTQQTRHVLTARAGPARLGRPQVQATRLTIEREVGCVHGQFCDLEMHDELEEVGRRRLRSVRVQTASREVASRLPAGGEVAKECRLQKGTFPTVLTPTPRHVVRTADLDVDEVGLGVV